MKSKLITTTLLFLSAVAIQAQNDSLGKRKIQGFSLELQLLAVPAEQTTDQLTMREFAGNTSLLTADVSGYQKGYNYFRTMNFPGLFSARAFFNLSQNRKTTIQVYAGIGLGPQVISSVAYFKDVYDTTGIYYNAATNQSKIEVDKYQHTYYYSVNGKRLLVPVGINFGTNRAKLFSFSAGLEAAPGISFDYKYSGSYVVYKNELILDEKSSYNEIDSYSKTQGTIDETKNEYKSLNGVGFSGYLSVPLTINLRLSRRINILKHFSLSAAVSPGYYVSANKITGISTTLILPSSLGMRYNIF